MPMTTPDTRATTANGTRRRLENFGQPAPMLEGTGSSLAVLLAVIRGLRAWSRPDWAALASRIEGDLSRVPARKSVFRRILSPTAGGLTR